MSVARMARTSTAERLNVLEQRADRHDARAEQQEKILQPMAEQLAELYALWTKAKAINWFVVKLAAFAGASLGGIAVVLTIAEKARAILH